MERRRKEVTGKRATSVRSLSAFLPATILAVAVASGCVGATGGGSSSGLMTDPSSVSFGDVATGESSMRSVTVTNASASEMSVSDVSISGPGFSASGVPAGLVLASGESKLLNITFAPASSGPVNGSITLWEEPLLPSAVTAVTIPVSGNGVDPSGHSVTLTWNASPSDVAGYRAYRSSSPDGPYSVLNSAPNPQLSWVDSTVQAGKTYYYVVTAVTVDNGESEYSNQAAATVPSS